MAYDDSRKRKSYQVIHLQSHKLDRVTRSDPVHASAIHHYTPGVICQRLHELWHMMTAEAVNERFCEPFLLCTHSGMNLQGVSLLSLD